MFWTGIEFVYEQLPILKTHEWVFFVKKWFPNFMNYGATSNAFLFTAFHTRKLNFTVIFVKKEPKIFHLWWVIFAGGMLLYHVQLSHGAGSKIVYASVFYIQCMHWQSQSRKSLFVKGTFPRKWSEMESLFLQGLVDTHVSSALL